MEANFVIHTFCNIDDYEIQAKETLFTACLPIFYQQTHPSYPPSPPKNIWLFHSTQKWPAQQGHEILHLCFQVDYLWRSNNQTLKRHETKFPYKVTLL